MFGFSKEKVKNKIEVVIPVGVGNPEFDTPNLELLEFGLKSIKNQTIPVKLTVAMDKDLPKEKQKLIKKYANKIVIFPAGSFYRAGSIWKKIWKCWEMSDCEFVAWQGYDDYSAPNRFEFQLEAIERDNKNSCFGINHIFTDNIEDSKMVNNGLFDYKATIGNHPEFMGCFLIRRQAILESGLGAFQNKWGHYFEGLLFAHICKIGYPTNSDGRFYFRDHKASISQTKNPQWVEQQRALTGYSYEQNIADWESIKFNELCQKIKREL